MKLKIYKNYLKEEIQNIISDKNNKKTNDYENSNYLLLMLILAICFFLPTDSICEECIENNNSEITNTGWLFPNTWKCKKCSYENYKGINYCAICGSSYLNNFYYENIFFFGMIR